MKSSALNSSSMDRVQHKTRTVSTVDSEIAEMAEMADEVEIDRTQTLKFDSKVRRVKASDQTAGSHEVTFSVNMAMAIKATLSEETTQRNPTHHRMSAVEIPKALSYFHIEYKICPDDTDTMKTDVVFFGAGAKVYPDRCDARAVKVWNYENQTWVAWTQNIKVHVGDNLLKSLSNYQLTIKVWDSRDKCGTKARFDKPKGFRFPTAQLGQDPESIGGVKSCVLNLSRQFERAPSAKVSMDRQLPTLEPYKASPMSEKKPSTGKADTITKPTSAPKVENIPTIENYAVYALSRSEQHHANMPFDRLTKLAGPIEPEPKERPRMPSGGRSSKTPGMKSKSSASNSAKRPGQISQPSPQPTDFSAMDFAQESTDRKSVEASRTGRGGRKAKVIDPEQEIYDKQGRLSLTLNMAHLFTRPALIERLPESTLSLDDMLVSISLDKPLLSDVQKSILNPLIIRIKGAKDMPSTPHCYEDLQELCEPAYCQYSFFNLPMHRTVGKQQCQQIIWDDIQVILTGLTDISTLRECLGGPALSIEVHDRDKKPVTETLTAALFGDDLEDEKICNIGVVTSKRTTHSAFGSQAKSWNSFGVSKVPLGDLLRGPKLISLTVPIIQCSNPDILGVEATIDGKIMGVSGAVDGPTDQPLATGHYIDSNASLTVSLEVFYSLSTKSIIEKRMQQSNNCPFGKIMFVMSADNYTFLDSMNRVIKRLNALTLKIEDSPDHVISTTLHNYKLKFEEISDGTFNLITGFHVFDGQTHIVVLEGPKGGCIQSVWFSLGRDLIRRDDIRVLFNDDFSFSKRLYSDLDVDIGQITIHDSLENIVQQPLLYVRDIVPKDCFQGITRLRDLSVSHNLQSVISNDLLPTSLMMKAVSREFGLPISISGDGTAENEGGHAIAGDLSPTKYISMNRWTNRLDNMNETYLQNLHERKESDHVRVNIERVREASVKLHQSRVQSCPVRKVCIPEREGFNYSNQALNSSLQAKEMIRQQCNPQRRYTYSHRFLHSATMEPINVEEALKAQSTESKARWRTAQGWTSSGFKSNLDANRHPQLPDPARRESIKQPWIENQLHSAVLKPTIEGRQNYPSAQRKQDFDNYTPGKGVFIQEPHTIMSTGVEKDREQANASRKAYDKWSTSLVVDDPLFRVHRVLPQTEMCIEGPKAGNQIDCLQGMRKDPLNKYGLVKPGYQDIPSLSVLKIDPPVSTGNYTVDNSEAGDLRKNFVPRQEAARGFNPIYRSREVVTMQTIGPLTSSERKTNLFFKHAVGECA